MVKKIMITLAALLVCSGVFAGKTYTPEQLMNMTQRGVYPEQGPLNREETVKFNWAACLARQDQMTAAMAGIYPLAVIVDTKLMKGVKFWVNDAATTLTCFGDGRMHLTSAPYK